MKKYVSFILIAALFYGCAGNKASRNEKVEGHHVVADHGMVVSAHPQASAVGTDILMKGGNAVDASVATGFALAVCYPAAGNIGGGGFMVIRTADGRYDVIDYREKAPLTASRDMYLDHDGKVIDNLSTDSHLSSGVPGSVDGLISVHSKYGKLSFREVIQPSIDLARNGFRLTREQALSLNSNRDAFVTRNSAKTAFVSDSLWKTGDILKQPDLASTLERIRDKGRDGFYSGETAGLIIREMKRGRGIISEEDLSAYRSVYRKPLVTEYKGLRLVTVPPPSGGGLLLCQLLGMTESFPLKEWGFHSAKSVHAIVEAERRAFADRAKFSGDPDFVDVPVNEMINKKYLAGRMADFNPEKASLSSEISAGSPAPYESRETTHYSVVDQDGNAVSVTTTLNNSYGCSIVVDGAGFLLNDEMDDFSVKPGVPNMYGLVGAEANAIQPGKRMLSSMTPVIIEKDGKLLLVVGSPGGSTIPTTVFQVIIDVAEYNMNLFQAVDTGRFHHQWLPEWISYEKGSIDSLNISELKQMGHQLRLVSSLGRVNAVQILPDGRIEGAADKRGDNSACGY